MTFVGDREKQHQQDATGKVRGFGSSWYRGKHCHFTPAKTDLTQPDAVDQYILAGWVPPEPLFPLDANVLAVGSCFAQHIGKWFAARQTRGGASSTSNFIRYGAGFINTFTLRQQFEWALGHKETKGETLYVRGQEGLNRLHTTPEVREATRQLILDAEVFILTLGLSEVWCDKQTGEVFFSAIPTEVHDPDQHEFRVSTVSENLDNLQAILALIRGVKPVAPVIFTLSPVPLVATFRPVSCITANQVSKAILRVAVDELMRGEEEGRNLYYWPSYEIVRDFIGPDAYKEDRRHITPATVNFIMEAFTKYFVKQ